MADAKNPIPSAQPGDSDDVELALETAQRMYRTGDHAEALKWLRRGASAAEEAGDDMRQLQLARAAADLAATISSNPQVVTSAPSVAPPKSALPSPTPSRLPQPPPSKQPPPAPSAKGSMAPGPAKPSVAPGPGVTPQPPSTSGGPPPLPSTKSRPAPPSAAPPPRGADSQPPPARASEHAAPAKPSISIKPKAAESVASSAPVVTPSVAPAARTVSASPAVSVTPRAEKPAASNGPSGFIDMGTGARGAVRVAVRISARDESLYIVRPLPQGQKVPPGAREARLVFEDG